VSGVYKVIAKVLANRLKRVVAKIILKPLNVFVKGRLILDFVLMAKCETGVLYKLDIGEAYNLANLG
jgi:hypothetical protein